MATPIQLIRVYLGELEGLRDEYLQYITDQSIPLEVRWEAFVSVPQMHRTSPTNEWIPDIPCDWSAVLGVYRYERIDLVEFVNQVERGEYDHILPKGRAGVNAAKEYLLANNLGACINDW